MFTVAFNAKVERLNLNLTETITTTPTTQLGTLEDLKRGLAGH